MTKPKFKIDERVLYKCGGCGWSSATILGIIDHEGEMIYNIAHDGYEFPWTTESELREHPKTGEILYHQEVKE